MPPVAAFAVAAIAGGLAASGLVAGLTILGVSLTSLLVNIAISFLLTGIAGLLQGNGPSQTPAEQKQNIRQPIASRMRYYGRNKVGGVFAFLNDTNSTMHMVLMLCQGEIDAFEEHWFNDDQLTVSGGNVTAPANYVWKGTTWVTIGEHLGADDQAADSTLVSAWSGVLDSNFRLLGIAYSRLSLKSPKAADFSNVYPAGLPTYNAVARFAKVWDPRDSGQDPDDESTWAWTQNAGLIHLDYLWHNDGMRLPRALMEAGIDVWKDVADKCDVNRDLDGGGTEPMYRLSGGYKLSDAPKQILPLMLNPVDGRVGLRADGAIVMDVGAWQEPDLTIAETYLYSYTLSRGRQQSDVRNEIRAQYVSPDNNYVATEADPWQNTDSIDVDGLQSMMMDLTWCPSHAQARYRMKIEAARHDAKRWNGQIITKAYGLKFLSSRSDGQRRRMIYLVLPELGMSSPTPFEVARFSADLASGRCTFSITQMFETDWDWTPAEEEGTAGTSADPIEAGTVEDPDNLTVSVETVAIAGGGAVKRLDASVDAPTQPSLTLTLEYRVHDGGVTDDDAIWTAFTMDGPLAGHTDPLPDAGVYDTRALFTDPTGRTSSYVYDRSETISYGDVPSTPGTLTGATAG